MVGLVEDSDLHAVEGDVALLHQVFETAGAGDDDVDATVECGDLAVLRDATEDGGDPELVCGRQRFDGDGDLGGQFAGGSQDQSARTAGLAVAGQLSGEAGHHRDGEGEGLAASGLSTSEHVTSRECVGEGVGLDGKRFGLALCGEDIGECVRYAERSKSSHNDEMCLSGRVLHPWPMAVRCKGWRDCRWAVSIAVRKACAGCTWTTRPEPGGSRSIPRRLTSSYARRRQV